MCWEEAGSCWQAALPALLSESLTRTRTGTRTGTCARTCTLGASLLSWAHHLSAGPTKTGSPGTFNYLIDAILAVPRTRQMYVRRLRTLMDAFMATGRMQVSWGGGC